MNAATHTSRPVKTAVRKPAMGIQHLSGQAGKAQIEVKKDSAKLNNQNNASKPKRWRKRKQKGGVNSTNVIPVESAVEEPAAKKRNEQPTKGDPSNQSYSCDDCDLTFSTFQSAMQHFKGKRHVLMIKAKINGEKEGKKINKNDQQGSSKEKDRVDSSKTKPVESVVQEGAAEKSNEQREKKVPVPDEQVKCDDCNLVFRTALHAIPHFKGKRHALTMAKKVQVQQTQTISRWQGREPAKETPNQQRTQRRGSGSQRGRIIQREGISRSGGQRGGTSQRAGKGGGGVRRDGGAHGGINRRRDNYEKGHGINRPIVEEDRDEQLLKALKNYYGNPMYNIPNPRKKDDNIPYNNIPRNQPRNEYGSTQRKDFFGNPPPSHHGTHQYQTNNQPTQSKEFFSSRVESQKDAYKDGTMYNDKQTPNNYYDRSATSSDYYDRSATSNHYYDRSVTSARQQDNLGGSSGNYYSKDYRSNNYSNSNVNYE